MPSPDLAGYERAVALIASGRRADALACLRQATLPRGRRLIRRPTAAWRRCWWLALFCSFADLFVESEAQVSASLRFDDTLAILQLCQRVVTSDTALVHLAGALGRPTELLLKHLPEWRWGLGASTTPWYPSVRLWRQQQPGDWAGVAQRLAAALSLQPPPLEKPPGPQTPPAPSDRVAGAAADW